ncbi:hypothetical protein L208DRAFT_1383489 [Tricholoma matsutake]|nr:hypothetical protein L208DRAFT_1383489 [Tricholoma matsutake 945]
MAPTSSQNSSDPWDQPTASTSFRPRALVKAAPIPDDWEDDEDDEEPQNEDDNRRIWEDANTKSPNPMPALIISPSATSSRSVLSPPPGAFQPTMRILKRPSNSTSPTPPPSSSTSETIKQREARYQAARERIFREENDTANSSSQPVRESKSPIPNQIVRNPRGPGDYAGEDVTTGNPTRGFEPRRSKWSPAASQGINGNVQEHPIT